MVIPSRVCDSHLYDVVAIHGLKLLWFFENVHLGMFWKSTADMKN